MVLVALICDTSCKETQGKHARIMMKWTREAASAGRGTQWTENCWQVNKIGLFVKEIFIRGFYDKTLTFIFVYSNNTLIITWNCHLSAIGASKNNCHLYLVKLLGHHKLILCFLDAVGQQFPFSKKNKNHMIGSCELTWQMKLTPQLHESLKRGVVIVKTENSEVLLWRDIWVTG